jgi:hypothetical protein
LTVHTCDEVLAGTGALMGSADRDGESRQIAELVQGTLGSNEME